MTDQERQRIIANLKKTAKWSKAEARAYLVRVGMITPTGRLTKRYGG